jgi:hypothetical protein
MVHQRQAGLFYEAVSAQGNPWQLPVKQEPAEAPHHH